MKSLEDMTEPELEKVMAKAGKAALSQLPPGSLFVLLACSPEGRTAQYICNANLHDCAGWMLETMWRWNRDDHVPR